MNNNEVKSCRITDFACQRCGHSFSDRSTIAVTTYLDEVQYNGITLKVPQRIVDDKSVHVCPVCGSEVLR